jgi:hypothetical protein
VVKKLPVLLKGKISVMNKKINGIIILLFLSVEIKKYFFTSDKNSTFKNIIDIIIKPIIPVSVKISK